MKLPDKHKPVLLNEVIKIFEETQKDFETMICIDCTLGQAGHSFEILKNLKEGVLLSIDLYKSSIEWTAKAYEFPANLVKVEDSKKWILINDNFSNFDLILENQNFKQFDFLLADLGFSNLQLENNLGISYSARDQNLDMRYGNSEITAADILNEFDQNDLISILEKFSDLPQNLIDATINRIQNYRKQNRFERVYDLERALGNISSKVNSKLFQVLRIIVNKEDEKLIDLAEKIKTMQSSKGKSLIITFNKFEEEILQKAFGEHEIVEPNIKEIISNPQSRSAKLHIYKTK